MGSPVQVGTGREALPGGTDFIKACIEAGILLNLDSNSGEPIGVSVAQLSCPKGVRSHSASAFLPSSFQSSFRDHLTIVTGTVCSRVFFKSGRAKGVELYKTEDPSSKSKPLSSKEIIITAGAIGSPHLLLLSGIGDEQHLNTYSIPVVTHVPGVGMGLQE